MTSVRALRRPPTECAARSSGPRYASTSTSLPHKRVPSTSRTRSFPSRPRATAIVSRWKTPGPRTEPFGPSSSAPGVGSARSALGTEANLLALRMSPTFVHVESLVSELVHRLPVHTGPPRDDTDAELHRHRCLGASVQLLERSPHAGADLVGMAFVGIWHGKPELITAQAHTRVSGTRRSLQLVRKDSDCLVAEVVAVRVVDVLQVVEVDHHQCKAALVALRSGHRAIDRAFELRPVGEPGEVIGARLFRVLPRAVQRNRDLIRDRGDALEVARLDRTLSRTRARAYPSARIRTPLPRPAEVQASWPASAARLPVSRQRPPE